MFRNYLIFTSTPANTGRPKGHCSLTASNLPQSRQLRLSDGSKTDCYCRRTGPCVALEPHRIDALMPLESAPTDTHPPAPCRMPETKAPHQHSGQVKQCPA